VLGPVAIQVASIRFIISIKREMRLPDMIRLFHYRALLTE